MKVLITMPMSREKLLNKTTSRILSKSIPFERRVWIVLRHGLKKVKRLRRSEKESAPQIKKFRQALSMPRGLVAKYQFRKAPVIDTGFMLIF
jgi:hypothetical protein